MSLKSKMPLQVWILTLSAFAIGTAEFVIAGVLPQVAGSLRVTEGQAGNLITAYALAIVAGGPILTLWLARFERRKILIGLMTLFIAGNLIGAFTTNYSVLLASRVIAGLTQGPFYGIGAVVATKLVSDKLAGQAVGQMFAGLTLANVLGVPAGTWIGNAFGWNMTFLVISALRAWRLPPSFPPRDGIARRKASAGSSTPSETATSSPASPSRPSAGSAS
jgi:DHA1 family inner membrane transport protein